MMVEIRDKGVQIQERSSTFLSSEALLTSLLSPCRSMFLLHQIVTVGLGDYLMVINLSQTRDLSDGCPVAA